MVITKCGCVHIDGRIVFRCGIHRPEKERENGKMVIHVANGKTQLEKKVA